MKGATTRGPVGEYHVGAVRVLVIGAVIALPGKGWSGECYGASISKEWLISQGRPKLPGNAERRRALARAIRQALDLHHGREVTP